MLTGAAHRIAAIPAVYDLIQRVTGLSSCNAFCRVQVSPVRSGAIVIDAGGGTALARDVFPRECIYICLDTAPEKLSMARRRAGALAVLGDIAAMPFPNAVADLVFARSVAHHLDEDQLVDLLVEARRVLRPGGRFVLVEPYRNPGNPLSQVLWRYDRGSNPRSREALVALMNEHFSEVSNRTVRTAHHVLVSVGTAVGGAAISL